jgi:hypothetical protein
MALKEIKYILIAVVIIVKRCVKILGNLKVNKDFLTREREFLNQLENFI